SGSSHLHQAAGRDRVWIAGFYPARPCGRHWRGFLIRYDFASKYFIGTRVLTEPTPGRPKLPRARRPTTGIERPRFSRGVAEGRHPDTDRVHYGAWRYSHDDAGAMKARAVDFLAKPFCDQDLLDAITTAIQRDQQRRK